MGLLKYFFNAGEKFPAENANSIDPDNVPAQSAGHLDGGNNPSAIGVFQALGGGANNGKFKINIDGVVYDNVAVNFGAGTFVVSYVDSVSGLITAQLGTINAGSLVLGAKYTFAGTYSLVECCFLDSTHFVVVYHYAYMGGVRLATINSDGTITFGAEVQIQNGQTMNIEFVNNLGGGKFLVTWKQNGDTVYCIVGTLSAGVITFGGAVYCMGGFATGFWVDLFDATHFIVGYMTNPNVIQTKVGTIAGNVITFGGAVQYFGSWTDRIAGCVLSTSNVIAVCGGTNFYLGTVSAYAVTYGAVQTLGAGSGTPWLVKIDATHFLICYSGGTAYIGTLAGSTLTLGSPFTFEASAVSSIKVTPLNSTQFLMTYKNVSNYDCSVVVNISGATLTFINKYTASVANTGISWSDVLAPDVTYANIATWVQNAIIAVTGKLETVVYSVNHFIITSSLSGRFSKILKLMTPSSGTDISGAGATLYLDCGTNAIETLGAGIEYLLPRLNGEGALAIPIKNNPQVGTTYSLDLKDAFKYVVLTNASAIAVTIPTNAVKSFPIGTEIYLIQGGAGKVTLSGSGVTINSLLSYKSIAGAGGQATLVKVATDTWQLYGNLIA